MNPYLTWSVEKTFSLFSLNHLLALALLFFFLIVIYLFRSTLRKKNNNLIFRVVLVAVLTGAEASFHLWFIYHSEWRITTTLPLQLSSISLFLAIFLLITKQRFLFEVTLFAGTSSALLAMITPELSYPYPHYRFFHFFVAHGAIVATAWFMIVVERYIPSYQSIWRAFFVLNCYTFIIFIMNILIGSNYMFLMEKPGSNTIYEYLGNWPWYILSLEFVAITVFHLIYVPFIVVKRQNSSFENRREQEK